MKAVILAAGEGHRLRPITSSRPKPLIPIAGKPLLEHTILGLKSAGIDSVLLIVGYKEEMIKEYFQDGITEYGVKIEYITQQKYLGTAHATNYAKKFVGNDLFLLMYGDLLVDNNIFPDLIRVFEETKVEGVISLIEVSNPESYGIITLNDKKNVEKIMEKPPKNLNLGNLANAGIYIFTPLIFEAIEKTIKSERGELELTDSMEIMISKLGGTIKGYPLKNRFWSDIGLPWQVLEANKYLLDNISSKNNGQIEEGVHLENQVYIGKGTKIRSGSYVQGPCFIGENCLIGPNAFIRPYSFISKNCHIGMSEIKNSIILSNSNIPHFNYIGDSIVCENVNLGAGTKTSNLRFDNKSVKMTIKGEKVNSKRRKLGVIFGPNSQSGINASIMCGKKVGENSIVGAHTLINIDIPPNSLYYQDENGKLNKKNNPFYKS